MLTLIMFEETNPRHGQILDRHCQAFFNPKHVYLRFFGVETKITGVDSFLEKPYIPL